MERLFGQYGQADLELVRERTHQPHHQERDSQAGLVRYIPKALTQLALCPSHWRAWAQRAFVHGDERINDGHKTHRVDEETDALPATAIIMPATAGPTAHAALTMVELRLTALRTFSLPTISSTKDWRAGF